MTTNKRAGKRGDQIMAGKKGRSGRKPSRKTSQPKTVERQKCSGPCQRVRPARDFYPNKGRRTGLSAVCRECHTTSQNITRYRRIIRTQGSEALVRLILETDERLRLMRQVLHEFEARNETND